MRFSDRIWPTCPACVFPKLSPSSWPLTRSPSFVSVVQVRVHALLSHSHMAAFWYADTQTQVSLVQVHPTVFLTHSRSPRNSRGPAGSQYRSQEASTSQGWDSRLAWRGAFDVALHWAMLPCYWLLISSSSCCFLVDRPRLPPLTLFFLQLIVSWILTFSVATLWLFSIELGVTTLERHLFLASRN